MRAFLRRLFGRPMNSDERLRQAQRQSKALGRSGRRARRGTIRGWGLGADSHTGVAGSHYPENDSSFDSGGGGSSSD